MKKFLFTLAALLMVGTAVADDYWYIDDFQVPQSAVGTNIEVIVKAHFDNAVAAAQIDFTFPEGMVLRKIDQGTDFTNMMYHDDWGDTWPADQTVFVGATATANVGWAFADMDYYQDADGNWVEAGSVKFLPGDYENQIKLTIRVTDAFQGGTITVHSEPSCTYDNRPDVHPCPEGQKIDKVCTVTLEGATPQLEDLTGEIVVSQPDDNGVVTVTYNGPEEVTITVNDQPVAESYQLEDGVPMTFNVTVSAEGYNDLTAEETRTWNKPQPKDLTGNIVVSQPDDNGVVTVSYTGPEEVTITVNDEPVAASYQLEDGVPMTFNVTVSAEGYNDLTATETRTWTKPGPKDLTGEIVVSQPDDNGVVTVTYNGPEEVTITVNGEPVAASYQLEDGVPMTFTVVVSADGYNDLTANETRTWTKPEPQETTTYVKVTSNDQLVAGKHYILVAGEYAMGEVVANSTAPGVAITLNGDEAEATADVTVLTLGESLTQYGATYWPVQLPNGKYLAVAGTNKFKMVDDASSTWNMWKISATFSMTDGDYNYPIKKSRINDFGPTNSSSETTVAVLYVEKTDEPVLQDLTGEIVVSQPDDNGVVTVTYTGTEEVTITVNDQPVAESYQLEDGVPMTFTVVVSAEGYNDLTAEETRTWTKPQPKELTGEIVVSEPDANGVVTVTYNGPEEVTITVNNEPVAESYQLEDGVPMEFNVVVSAEGYEDLTATVTRTWNKPADPTLGGYFVWSNLDEEGHFTVEYKNFDVEGPFTLVVKDEDGNVMNPEVGDAGEYYQAAEGTHTYTAEVTATGYQPKTDTHVYTYTVPTYAPTPVLNWDETTFTMTASLPNREYTDADIKLYKDNEPVENPYTVTQTYQPQTIMFKAYVPGKDGDNDSEYAYKQVTVPAKDKTPSGTPTIDVQEGDAAYVITGQGSGTVVMYDAEGNEIANPYTVERTDETQTIIITVVNTDADTQDEMFAPTQETFTVIVPAKEPVTPVEVGQPTFQGYSQDGITGYGVNIAPTTTGSEIKYRVMVWDTEANDGQGDWKVIRDWTDYEGTENEIWYTEEGKYRVEAYAYIGENQSETVSHEFVVTPATPTSIDEMNAGKTIAGVRYFNMAGQEMQEANGMTIVVTTYTDGTTSAVKVMK